jgi:hypothetical protein
MFDFQTNMCNGDRMERERDDGEIGFGICEERALSILSVVVSAVFGSLKKLY